MADYMRQDLTDGVGGIKCGIIGEVGTAWPITDFECRSLRASAAVQDELGCPVIIHPGRHPNAPGEAMRILLEAGGKARHTVMSHLDRTIFDKDCLLEFAKIGCYLEYDLFGVEVSHYQLTESIDMPSDAQRIQTIKHLLNEGCLKQILISHDIHTKHRLMKYGGHGYSHILLNIVPKMLKRGITQHQVDTILKQNPQTWLQFFK
ncbi:phosphotriesterase-related protein [Elysia marginata]|uniref:Phosphotriesterase-related protein n=1 Tax=Elysia marginata TaxID=1093978 RepID=A0AAV4FGQ3_9GAST|nr:phosphotriesterase-related protein [Elysia marginata]